MLLLHQIGSVKIGEIVRYSVTYTPAHDRILPAPEQLYLKIRNTSSSALRAAFVHGPYTLYVDAYPAQFNPNEKFAHPRKYGVPEFEPMLKAGGTWTCRLLVPEHVRHDAGVGHAGHDEEPASVSWIINISSQVIFSTSAAVHFEVLLARDPKALEIGGGITAGIPAILGRGSGGSVGGNGNGVNGGGNEQGRFLQPGKVSDYQRGRDGRHPDQPRGVFSRAIRMRLEDTAALWNKPELPGRTKPPSVLRVRASANGLAIQSGGCTSTSRSQLPPPPQQQHQQHTPQDEIKEDEQHKQQETLEKSKASEAQAKQQTRQRVPVPDDNKPKKVHLVILTHGLHSNLGGDMLFIKESIDLAVQQAKIDRRARLAKERADRAAAWENAGNPPEESAAAEDEKDEDDEEVIVRGYSGNATRTERGIKYLGKRLARYVLSMTYPDQPYLPSVKKVAEKTAVTLHGGNPALVADGQPLTSHKNSTIQNVPTESLRQYKYTKISFIAHSLGGPVQTYAVAYIQKHSPRFFELIEPINFIAMASPFLGLNHENPLYVKFALDFGLVGRTGQDLGLTWRAPTLARSGWSSLVGNLGESAHKKVLGEPQPESKPLLRILPTGPAHTALKKFRNRTVYSNVVNDGIVPLRTSCLLFLDWQGLDRVEKARREAGLVETVMGFGWAELVGNNATTPRVEKEKWERLQDDDDESADGTDAAGYESSRSITPDATGRDKHDVPQPPANATTDDDQRSVRAIAISSPLDHDDQTLQTSADGLSNDAAGKLTTASTNNSNPFSNFFSNLFKSSNNDDAAGMPSSATTGPAVSPHPKPHPHDHHTISKKQSKIYQRSQTLRSSDWQLSDGPGSATSSKSRVTTGHEFGDDAFGSGMSGGLSAPPRTSFFESATDIINPKLPSVEFLIDPTKRPRTIFHDRIYHPSDIPSPALKHRGTDSGPLRRLSFQQRSKTSLSVGSSVHAGGGSGVASNAPSPQLERVPSLPSPFSLSTNATLSNGSSYGPRHQDSSLSALDYDDPVHFPDRDPDEVVDTASMKVEEKIARAYHRGLSWRKVLVKLEPDAHNNMVVRRMFANAFGWPVVKHMVDAHFSDSAAARMRDEIEDNDEHARPLHEAPDEHGAETRAQKSNKKIYGLNDADALEKRDRATNLPGDASATESKDGHPSPLASRPKLRRPPTLRSDHGKPDNVMWSDRDWNDSGDESDVPSGSGDDGSNEKSQSAAVESASASASETLPKSALPSSADGVSVTATGGTTTGPLSPLKSVLAASPGVFMPDVSSVVNNSNDSLE
ncbi:hypothetical protein SEPCBS119000_002014 [Sporothrix epigloea]|uniref:DUF676 domain-containing protein n=1 Tax=Sporothrix epigloea TaxID=1892477 RepID=A0ABP0DDU3_9PEZI